MFLSVVLLVREALVTNFSVYDFAICDILYGTNKEAASQWVHQRGCFYSNMAQLSTMGKEWQPDY